MTKGDEAIRDAARAIRAARVSHKRAAAFHRARAREAAIELDLLRERARALGISIDLFEGETSEAEEPPHGTIEGAKAG